MEQALPLDECEFDQSLIDSGNIASMTAEQYLSWVRYQADQLPHVFRAEVELPQISRQTKYLPEIGAVPECPVEYFPTEDWEKQTLSSFSELRTLLGYFGSRGNQKRIYNVPAMKDSSAWHIYCLGTIPQKIEISDSEDDNDSDSQSQIQSYIEDSVASEGFSAVVTEGPHEDNDIENRKRKLFEEYQLNKESNALASEESEDTLESPENMLSVAPETLATPTPLLPLTSSLSTNESTSSSSSCTPSASSPTEATGGTMQWPTPLLLTQFDQVMTQRVLAHHIRWLTHMRLSRERATWIFALLARLEKPLFQDTAAMIRNLYRICCEKRLELIDEYHKQSMAPSSLSSAVHVSEFDESLSYLNLIITITGSYFGQGESYATLSKTPQAGDTHPTVYYFDDDEDEDGGDAEASGTRYRYEEDDYDGGSTSSTI